MEPQEEQPQRFRCRGAPVGGIEGPQQCTLRGRLVAVWWPLCDHFDCVAVWWSCVAALWPLAVHCCLTRRWGRHGAYQVRLAALRSRSHAPMMAIASKAYLSPRQSQCHST